VRVSTVVMVILAGVFGLAAVFVAQLWLSHQDALRFGNALQANMLSEVDWPENAVPPGAFASVNEMLAPGKRIVLAPIEPNEPVLAAKITGPGQRATLSAVIHPGMKAVTVRVNDVEGVAGFILPGDRVDVMLTRRNDKDGTTDVVLQNAPVLAIDQLADERSDKPQIAKAVTLEVDTLSAQKLTLSAQLGVLSLALRKAGEAKSDESRRISATDIGRDTAPAEGKKSFSTITVLRAMERKDYSVPSEDSASWGESNLGNAATQ
jgi:pilus assembly protein CpaB